MRTTNSVDQQMARRLYDAHDSFKQTAFTHRRFKHKDMVPLLKALSGPLSVTQVGESYEGRSINQVKAGTGPTNVLLWSQMHGDEATATMAMFDIFNFLQAKNDGFDSLRTSILSKLTLYFVPMLNPDGAERFQRRTATQIDMNRDALRLQTPEGRLLKQLQQTLKPLVGFNLHDQNPRYSIDGTPNQAVISFLATAYDPGRHVNAVRKRSMQLIAGMNRVLQPFVPGQIGRYDDAFEPRAFGDNIQKWGTTLVLIESGGYRGDVEKMIIRKLNFVALLTALHSIAEGTYQQESIDDYKAIPENGKPLFDVLIRNLSMVYNGRQTVVDVGINHYETNDKKARTFYYKSQIDDMGDLSIYYGLDEIDATGLTVAPTGIYESTLDSPADLASLDLPALREQGITAFRVGRVPKDSVPTQPVHLLQKLKAGSQSLPLLIGITPTFLLKKDDQIMYRFVNGFYRDSTNTPQNGAVD